MSEDDGLLNAVASALGPAYRIDRELGGGGMSRAFAARDETLARDVVVKVLAPELGQGISLDRFMREIKLAALLQEPHIVPVYSAGVTAGGLPFYVMAYMRGDSLRVRMQQDRMPVTEAIGVLRDMARALAYAHRQGVIHRDIKPENVLLSYGSAVVADFGIAKAITAARAQASGGEAFTRAGMSLGTPGYMSPEQASGDQVDARSDLYAWGMVAYELLSGEHAFTDTRTNQRFRAAQISESPVHLMLKVPEVPVALAELVMRCLEKDPARRPVAATELVRVLDDSLLMSAPKADDSDNPAGNQRRRVLTAIAAAVLVAAFAFGAPRYLANVREARKLNPGMIRVDATPLTTVAVLPFANVGGDPQNEYFTDGVTDELSHALAQLRDVHLTGRTSTYAYKGKQVNALEIGKALNVGGVVTGSIQRAGAQLRVTTQLVNANDGLVLWSERFDRPAADVFAVQDELTKQIVAAIAPALRGKVASSAAQLSRGTASNDAYDLLMRGRYFFAKRGAAHVTTAIDYFRRATVKDTSFTRAYAYMAMAYGVLPAYTTLPTDSLAALGLVAARRALALDSTSADAHLAMALALSPGLHYLEAEPHFLLALKGMPGDASAHQWHGENLALLGRPAEGLREIDSARELDPSAVVLRVSRMGALMALRQFDEALAEGVQITSMDSTLLPERVMTSMALVFTGRAESGARIVDAVSKTQPAFPGVRGARVFAYAAMNRWTDASRVREAILDQHPRSDYDMMLSSIVFGDFKRALDVLEQAGQHVGNLQAVTWSISCEPAFDPIAKEPRFIAFIQSHGLTSCPITTPWPIARPRRPIS